MELEKSSGPRDAKSRITRYLTIADIALSADEERILERWECADRLMRSKSMSYDEMVKHIETHYHVSRWTARSDIASAQEVFSRSRTTNKKYHLHLHAERIDADIERVRAGWADSGHVPDAKEIAALARLHDSYTYAIERMPEDKVGKKQPPPIMLLNLVKGDQVNQPLTYEEALKDAQAFLENDQQTEDIDHEELPE